MRLQHMKTDLSWYEMQEPCHALLELANSPVFGAQLPPKLMVFVEETQELELVETAADELMKLPLKLRAGVIMASTIIEVHAKVLRSAAHAAALREARAAYLAAPRWGVRMPGQRSARRKKNKLHWPRS